MIRVLVADDHPIVRGGIVALLSAADDITVVAEAADGLEAVRLAAEHVPDVVLMDLRMPGLDGDEATARILAANPAIRVLVLTTYETDASILRAIQEIDQVAVGRITARQYVAQRPRFGPFALIAATAWTLAAALKLTMPYFRRFP